MFSNLSQNSIIYILETKDRPKLLTGNVNSISIPRPQYATFGQPMETVVDIVATVDGEKREFKRVPCNNTIANFGPDAFILADSKDSINSYISAARQNSQNIVNNYERNKQLVIDYDAILEDLNPALKADKEKDKIIQSLQEQVNNLSSGMQKILSYMAKDEDPKTKKQ